MCAVVVDTYTHSETSKQQDMWRDVVVGSFEWVDFPCCTRRSAHMDLAEPSQTQPELSPAELARGELISAVPS